MFIITIKYICDLAEIDRVLSAHRAHLEVYYEKGLLLASGPQTPREGGILVALGQDKSAIEKMISEDPYFKESLALYTITEFTPVKHRAEIAGLI